MNKSDPSHVIMINRQKISLANRIENLLNGAFFQFLLPTMISGLRTVLGNPLGANSAAG